MPDKYHVGDIIEVFDKIDPDCSDIATIKYIEPDNEYPGLTWLYLIANEEALNINLHPAIGLYWSVIEDCSTYIKLVSGVTN